MKKIFLVVSVYFILSVLFSFVNYYLEGITVRNNKSLDIQVTLTGRQEGSVKLINKSDRTVYNITIENSCEDFLSGEYIKELGPGEQILKSIRFDRKEIEEDRERDNTYLFCFLFGLVILLVLLYLSYDKKSKALFWFSFSFLVYFAYYVNLDIKMISLDTRYLNRQEIDTVYEDLYLKTVCTYTYYDKEYIDRNDNYIPDCIEQNNWYKDTDGDGLSDWEELCLTNTNMFSQYTNNISDSLYDTDKDGLSNRDEIELHSNPLSADSDGDGLSDLLEAELGTDLLYWDTDKDGLSDGLEYEYGYDGTIYNEEFKVMLYHQTDKLKFSVNAVGNGQSIQDFKIEPVTDNFLLGDKVPGYIGEAFNCSWEADLGLAVNSDTISVDKYYALTKQDIEIAKGERKSPGKLLRQLNSLSDKLDSFFMHEPIYIDGKETGARLMGVDIPEYIRTQEDMARVFGDIKYQFSGPVQIEFEFDKELLNKAGFDPCIYHYDESTQSLEEVETIVSGNRASATVSHFSTYILLDRNSRNEIEGFSYAEDSNLNNDIVFLIDVSSSMGENDKNNYRTKLVKRYVSGLGDSDSVAVYSFKKYYERVLGFTSDYSKVVEYVSALKTDTGDTDKSGTDYLSALKFVLDMFDNTNKSKHIILLSDGNATEDLVDIKDVITKAGKAGIKINAIGLGDSVNEKDLKKLVDGTGGVYVRFNNLLDIQELESVSGEIEINTYDKERDSNQDGISDYMTERLIDGKLRLGSGVRLDFSNIDIEDVDWDKDGVLNGDEISVRSIDGKSYLYCYSNPLSTDSDADGIVDKEDTAPLQKGLLGGIIGRLYIIACVPNGKTGHAYLVYESFTNDTRDISQYFYVKDKENASVGYTLVMRPLSMNSLGNFAHMSSNIVLPCNLFLDINTYGGITVDYEMFFPDRYLDKESTRVYASLITQESLDKMFNYLSKHDYYNVYFNNCATVAAGAWNEAFKNTTQVQEFNATSVSWLDIIKVYTSVLNPLKLLHSLENRSLVKTHIDLPKEIYRDIDKKAGEALRDYIERYCNTGFRKE